MRSHEWSRRKALLSSRFVRGPQKLCACGSWSLLCAEHVDNSTVEQVLIAVLQEILNLLNASARTSAKPENFIVDIALTLVANVLHPGLGGTSVPRRPVNAK